MADQDRWGEDRDRHRDRDESRDRWGGRVGRERGSEDRGGRGREVRPAGEHGDRTGRPDSYRDEGWGRNRTGGAGREDLGRGGGVDHGREDFGRGSHGGYEGGFGGYGGEGYGASRGRGSGHRGRGGDRENYSQAGYDEGGYGQGGQRDEGRGVWDRATDEVASWFGDEQAERRRREVDHRGRGPKGYRRSDERIKEDVSDRLSDDPYVDASDIEVGVSGGEVALSGTVDGREARRRAEDIAEGVSGVTHVQNNLRLGQRHASPPGGHVAGAVVGAVPEGTSFGTSDAVTGVGDPALVGRAPGPTPPMPAPAMASPPQSPADREAAVGQARAPTIAALFDSLDAANRAADHLAAVGITEVAISAAEDEGTGVAAAGPGGGRGVWDALAGIFMPDDDRRAYVEGVRRGGVLLTATAAEGVADEAVRILNRAGAVDLEARMGEWRASGSPGPAAGDVGAEDEAAARGLGEPDEAAAHAAEPGSVPSGAGRAERG